MLEVQYHELTNQWKAYTKDRIKSNPDDFVYAYSALGVPTDDTSFFREIYFLIGDKLKESSIGKKLFNRYNGGLGKMPYEEGNLKLMKLVTKQATNFSLPDLNGKNIRLSDYRGKWILVDFWASWCGPCRASFPHIKQTLEKFKVRNLVIVAISLDRQKEAWQKAIREDETFAFHHLIDLTSFEGEVAKSYMVTYIPTNFLINPKGEIIAIDVNGKELEKILSDLVL